MQLRELRVETQSQNLRWHFAVYILGSQCVQIQRALGSREQGFDEGIAFAMFLTSQSDSKKVANQSFKERFWSTRRL